MSLAKHEDCFGDHNVNACKNLHITFLHVSLAFGSTHTLNPVSTSTGFCDERDTDDWGEDPVASDDHESTLACLVSV